MLAKKRKSLFERLTTTGTDTVNNSSTSGNCGQWDGLETLALVSRAYSSTDTLTSLLEEENDSTLAPSPATKKQRLTNNEEMLEMMETEFPSAAAVPVTAGSDSKEGKEKSK